MPWHVLNSPLKQWEVMPSFLLGEWLFIAAAVLALVHAASQPGEARRRHLLVWLGALLAGTGNDAIFMLLPLVNNFWQAQATVMLTPRMPLYIPCVYIWFMYLPTVAVWRLGLPRWARAPLSGLAAIVVYAPYDITGAKFLWWTWHDSDGPISKRLLGVPLGSTIWVITFVAAFALLINWAIDREPTVKLRTAAKALPLVALCSTPLMMVQMTVLQQLDGGVPGPRGLVAIVLAFAAAIAAGWRRRAEQPRRPFDRALLGVVVVYFAALTVIMAAFDPASHRSASIHQTVGPCYVEAVDITGLTRFEFLCPGDFDEDFTFACTEPPADGARWYTVCGRSHRNRALWLGAVAALAALGVAIFGGLLGRAKTSRVSATSGPRHR